MAKNKIDGIFRKRTVGGNGPETNGDAYREEAAISTTKRYFTSLRKRR
jgi:hypothetical protein